MNLVTKERTKMKEIERIIWKHEGLNKADVSNEYKKSVVILVKAIEQYIDNVMSRGVKSEIELAKEVDRLKEKREQYIIKARIEVAQKAPYLVIDGNVISKGQFIAQLKKELRGEK